MDKFTVDRNSKEWIPSGTELDDLLKPLKVIRDPIHGDIRLTELESAVIDTREFQRLRTIQQLGPSSLVYNGATHTRFDHSIGAVDVTQYMINKININSKQYPDHFLPVDNYIVLLARLYALIHDVAHIAFGHTLEDEGKLFDSQWDDNKRIDVFLGENSEIGKRIIQYAGYKTLQHLKEILLAHSDDEIQRLEYPIVCDIVGNTICADLLDYLTRDMYYSGLKGTYDKRFLDYLTGQKYNNKLRLVISLFKPMKDEYRRDVVSEIMHLLRLRYSLAERIYYHHTKIAASAMLISAVNIAKIKNEQWLMDDLFNFGDQELLHKLETDQSSPDEVKFIIKQYRRRSLYKPIFIASYGQVKEGDSFSLKKKEITDELAKDPKKRYDLERKLENGILPPGSVLIYCPPKGMGRKIAEAKVQWRGNIIPLKDVDHYGIGEETRKIMKQHEELWRLYVFVTSDCYNWPQITKVVMDFNKATGLNQELARFDIAKNASPPAHEEVIYRHILEYKKKNKQDVPPEIIQSVLASANAPVPGQEMPKILNYNEFEEIVKDLIKKK
ncbi:MAG: hypothetical protein KGI33_00040 [Thaumarchaeota archaeon]|nr:hypothetical protein [Nitrososphaerota archaeon]